MTTTNGKTNEKAQVKQESIPVTAEIVTDEPIQQGSSFDQSSSALAIPTTEQVLDGLAELNTLLDQAESVVQDKETSALVARTEATELINIKHQLKNRVEQLAVRQRSAEIKTAFADRIKANQLKEVDALKKQAKKLKRDA